MSRTVIKVDDFTITRSVTRDRGTGTLHDPTIQVRFTGAIENTVAPTRLNGSISAKLGKQQTADLIGQLARMLV